MESGAVFPFLIRTPVLMIIVLLLILPGYILEQIEAMRSGGIQHQEHTSREEKRKVEMQTDAVVELSRLADSPLALNWFRTSQGILKVAKRRLTSSHISRDELNLI